MKKQRNSFQIKVKNEDSLRNLCDIIKWTNIHIKAFTGREEGENKNQKDYSKKQRLKNFPNLGEQTSQSRKPKEFQMRGIQRDTHWETLYN